MAETNFIYVGFNSRAAALYQDTGEIAWSWEAPSGSGYVTLHLDNGALFAAVNGHTYCLDPATGRQLWHNRMRGFGYGVSCLATRNGQTDSTVMELDEEERRRRSNS